MLEVSRPDIDTEEITDLKVTDRFIKLPIVPYLKLLNIVSILEMEIYKSFRERVFK